MDFEDLASRLGVDKEDFVELVELFITTSRSDMEKIRQGMQGKNASDAASAAHSIKGAAGNLGFEQMADLAKTMEFEGKAGSLDGFDDYLTELETHLKQLEKVLAEG